MSKRYLLFDLSLRDATQSHNQNSVSDGLKGVPSFFSKCFALSLNLFFCGSPNAIFRLWLLGLQILVFLIPRDGVGPMEKCMIIIQMLEVSIIRLLSFYFKSNVSTKFKYIFLSLNKIFWKKKSRYPVFPKLLFSSLC